MNPLSSWARALFARESYRPVAPPPKGLTSTRHLAVPRQQAAPKALRKHTDGFDRSNTASGNPVWGTPVQAKGSQTHTTAQLGHARFKDGFDVSSTKPVNLTGLSMAPAMMALTMEALELNQKLKGGFTASLDDLPKLG